MIFAPPETPYACGAFVFDILLPPEYPDRPPMVCAVLCALCMRRVGGGGGTEGSCSEAWHASGMPCGVLRCAAPAACVHAFGMLEASAAPPALPPARFNS